MRETKYNQNPQPRKAPIDREALWGKINNDPKFPISDDNPKKRFWLFGSIGLCLLVGIVFFCWPENSGNQKTNLIDVDQIENKKAEVNNESQLNVNQPLNTSISAIKNDIDKQSSEEALIETSTIATQVNDTIVVDSKPENITQTVDFNQSYLDLAFISEQSYVSQVTQTERPIKQASDNKKTSKIASSINLEVDVDKLSEPLTKTDIEANLGDIKLNRGGITAFDMLTAKNQLSLSDNLPSAEENLIDIKSKKGILVYANVSYGLSMHSVETVDIGGINDQIDIEPYLQNNESRAIEVGVKKRIFKRYLIGLGAELRQDWQKYNRVLVDTSFVFREDAFSPLIASQTEYTLHQKYQSANLLLSVDRIIPLRNVLLEVGGGLSYTLSMSTSGRVLDRQDTLIERADSFPIKTSGTFGAFAQAGVTYPLTEQWRVSMNVRYNIPTQQSPDTDLYQHRLTALRLGVGIGYEF